MAAKEQFPEQLADKKRKVNYTLVPPNALKGIADILTGGALKWGAYGWRNRKQEIYIAAAYRHAEAFRSGEILDKDTKQPHLLHAATNLILAAELQNNKKK